VIHGEPEATSAAALFDLLWESLADVLGTAASATLLRRAIKQAVSRTSWSEPVIVTRNGLDYEYRLPETWLPRIDGYEVGRRIRAALGKRVLLVALTGYGQEQDHRRSSKAGFDVHLVKPVSYDDLTRLLGRPGPSDA